MPAACSERSARKNLAERIAFAERANEIAEAFLSVTCLAKRARRTARKTFVADAGNCAQPPRRASADFELHIQYAAERFSASLEESWDRDPVQIPLHRAAIKRVDTGRRVGDYPVGIDPPCSRQTGYFLVGMESSCRDW
jgi:hypothetical protein